eukprot:1881723-Pyramimonas_sp.AAC.1
MWSIVKRISDLTQINTYNIIESVKLRDSSGTASIGAFVRFTLTALKSYSAPSVILQAGRCRLLGWPKLSRASSRSVSWSTRRDHSG